MLADRLDAQRAVNRLRVRRPLQILDSTRVLLDGARLVNFAGNDYLGLSHHPLLQPSAFAAESHRPGASASALVTGYTFAQVSAESRIARWKQTEDAVLLPSGYQANHAAIQTLAALGGENGRSVRFLIDKQAHASLIDAVRATGCPFRIYPHNQAGKLTRLLEEASPRQLQVVVTESIFSMDGDEADLNTLGSLKMRFGFVLLLDEAHGSGVYGAEGSGLAAERKMSAAVDISVCTFSKAAGLVGGAVCASKQFCEAIVNFGRAYLYSTAVPPALAMQIERSIDLMAAEPERQQRVRATARRVRSELSEMGVAIPPGDSPIIPIIASSEAAAIELSAQLRLRGILVPAIRPPTVAPNASRIRLTLSSEHSDQQIILLMTALRKLLDRREISAALIAPDAPTATK